MNRLISYAGVLVVVAAGLMIFGPIAVGSDPEPKVHLHFQQSPARPQPEWVKLVDHGVFDKRLAGVIAPEGLKIEIVAEAPTVVNPVGMTFDDDGTLHVLEWVAPDDPKLIKLPETSVTLTYKDGTKRKLAILRKPNKDRVKILIDSKGKGVYDEAKVILEEEFPSSILVHDGAIYLTGQGTVRRWMRSNEGGPYDKMNVIAQGFGGFHHQQVSGLTLGNDGWLTITCGDGDHFVEGSDGSRATVLRTGAIFRCRLDGSKMQVHSLGYCNPYRDVAFDVGFNMFHVDNDNEGDVKWRGCRLMHVPEGADFGWRLRAGARGGDLDPVRSAVYGEQPGKLAPLLKTGRGAPAGLLIYNDGFFPEEMRGLLYYPDVLRGLIRAYKVQLRAASFEVTHEFEFMRSKDPLFRPCQMIAGPDGAIYVCDWGTDLRGAGKLWGDGKHGRIYRITWAGREAEGFEKIATRPLDSWAKIRKQSDDELLAMLGSPHFSDRQRAQRELVRRGGESRPGLLKVLGDGEKPVSARIAALGAVQSLWDDEVKKCVLGCLRDAAEDVRRLAADALALNCGRGDKDAHEALVHILNDEDLAVRRSVYLALGKIRAAGADDVLANALQFDEGKDPYLTDGLVRAVEALGKPGIDKLLALADSGAGKDLDKVLDVYPALRSRAGAEGIPILLKNYHVTAAQKVRLIRSYTNYQLEPPLSLKALADYHAALPRASKDVSPESKEARRIADLVPVKLAALEVLASAGVLDGAGVRKTLLGLLDDKDERGRLVVVRAIEETQTTQAGVILEEMVGKEIGDELRRHIVKALGALKQPSSFASVEKILNAKKLEAALRLEAFRAAAAIDGRRAQKYAEGFLAADDTELQKEAVVVLGLEAQGAKLAGRRFLENRLPRALLPQVAEGLLRFSREDTEAATLLNHVMKGALKAR